MERLTESILRKTNDLPEGALASAKMLLHLGSRQAVDQCLSRLARSSDEGAAGADATRFYPDDDERLWTWNVVIEANGKMVEMVLKPLKASA